MTTAASAEAVVAAGHVEGCRAAIEVLRDGGSAVDAAVAAALTLTVVCPQAATLGGDVFLLIRDGADGRIWGVNGSGRSPMAATSERYAEGIPRSGWLSATVPGLLRALEDARARFGRLPLARLLAPAIALARDGFAVDGVLARTSKQRAEMLAGATIFQGLVEGQRLVQPELARSLELIAAEGADVLYRGSLAARLGDGGLIAAADLAEHRTLWQEPIAAPFMGRDIVTMPPNSYGLTLLYQLLALERDGIAAVDPAGIDFIRRGMAARRLAYAAAACLVADPESVETAARSALAEAIAGGPRARAGVVEEAEGGTTNVVVLDRAGNAVSLVASISAPFGAGVIAPGTGILLNNRMRGFSTDPTSPNCVGPARRPAHTLTPAMVLKDGAPELVLGTPGQAGQTATLAQFLARVLACNQPIADAIAESRWSVDLEGQPIVEADMAEELRSALPEFRPMPRGWITFGSLKVARAGAGQLLAFADRRRSAAAAGL